jgi:hypothetical protein
MTYYIIQLVEYLSWDFKKFTPTTHIPILMTDLVAPNKILDEDIGVW